jgi:hypothetical protein
LQSAIDVGTQFIHAKFPVLIRVILLQKRIYELIQLRQGLPSLRREHLKYLELFNFSTVFEGSKCERFFPWISFLETIILIYKSANFNPPLFVHFQKIRGELPVM